MNTIILLTTLILSSGTFAKGSLPSFPVINIQEGLSLVCTDGQFSFDLEVGERITNPNGFFQKKFKLSGYGVYGPRLSGVPFETIGTLSTFQTRVGTEYSLRAVIPELNGSLSLRQRVEIPGFGGTGALSGHIFVGEKAYLVKCD